MPLAPPGVFEAGLRTAAHPAPERPEEQSLPPPKADLNIQYVILSFKYFSGSGQLLTCLQASTEKVSGMPHSVPPPQALVHSLAERIAGRAEIR